jgi:hypothetical protein
MDAVVVLTRSIKEDAMSATSTKQNSNTTQPKKRQGPREGSVVWAMIQVLDGKRTPMRPAEILAEIKQRKLVKKLDGKTPEASVGARLAVHVGTYFERPEKGKYQLKKGVTAKSLSSGSTPTTRKKPKSSSRKPASRRRSTSRQSKPAPQPTANAQGNASAQNVPTSEPAAATTA